MPRDPESDPVPMRWGCTCVDADVRCGEPAAYAEIIFGDRLALLCERHAIELALSDQGDLISLSGRFDPAERYEERTSS